LNVLLVVTGCLQLGALVTRMAGRRHAALAMAGANAALALVLTLLIISGGEKIDAAIAVFVGLEATAAGTAAIGLAKRKESGWLFWPMWLWNFLMVYALVRLRFFFRVFLIRTPTFRSFNVEGSTTEAASARAASR
jgi:hypothetical protein